MTTDKNDATNERGAVAPLLLWFRRDLRLADHPMLTAAVATGRPLIALFLLDPETENIGAASKLRLDLALRAFAKSLGEKGLSLTLRRGTAQSEIPALLAETGATSLYWSRLYDRASISRDSAIKAHLQAMGYEAKSFAGHVLHEPFSVATGTGGPYRVFTPFWKAIRGRDPGPALAPPKSLHAAPAPRSDLLDAWALPAAMRRGADVVAAHLRPGEAAARARLDDFLDRQAETYADDRDRMDRDGTSGLSDWLTWGEIGVREIWHAGRRAMEEGRAGAEAFLRELGWRDYAWHLLYHYPEMDRQNWRPEWDGFPWRGDNEDAEAWRRAMTGEPLVDAALREMFVTGRMHNRARMIAASYLTKHLLTDWRIGLAWFADCLTDWDPAANAMGWQWVAGSGPDASPFFRIFNPEGQAQKFDPQGAYRAKWLSPASPEARAYYEATPCSWQLSPQTPRPAPRISLAAGRARALAAYEGRKTAETRAES